MKSKTNSAGNVLALLNRFKFPILTILAILIFSIYGKVSETNENRDSNVTTDTVEVTTSDHVQNPFFVDGFPERALEINSSPESSDLKKNAKLTDKIIVRSGTMVISGGDNISALTDAHLNDRGFEILGSATALSGFDPLRCAQKHTQSELGNVKTFSTKCASKSLDTEGKR